MVNRIPMFATSVPGSTVTHASYYHTGPSSVATRLTSPTQHTIVSLLCANFIAEVWRKTFNIPTITSSISAGHLVLLLSVLCRSCHSSLVRHLSSIFLGLLDNYSIDHSF